VNNCDLDIDSLHALESHLRQAAKALEGSPATENWDDPGDDPVLYREVGEALELLWALVGKTQIQLCMRPYAYCGSCERLRPGTSLRVNYGENNRLWCRDCWEAYPDNGPYPEGVGP
jgi:hypothetical protein